MQILLLSQCTHCVLAQELPLVWHLSPGQSTKEIKMLDLETYAHWPISKDTAQVWIGILHAAAYLEASFDSMWLVKDSIHIGLHLGPTYTWSYLDISEIPNILKDAVQIRSFEDRLFHHEEIKNLIENLLKRAEDHGYPFAAVRLRQTGDQSGSLEAKLEVRLNDQISIEKIKIEGDLKLSSRYLNHYVDITEGELFNKSKILRARTRLQELNFIKSNKDPTIEFLGSGATLQFLFG